MKEMTFQKGSIVGVFLLVFLALVLLLVPAGIAADDPQLPLDQVGIFYFASTDTCYMVDQIGDIVPQLAEDIFINDNQSGDYPLDIAGILRCQTTIANDTGRAINYYGAGSACRVYFDPDEIGTSNFTTSWSQTISASGNAILTCQFKKAPK